MNRSVFFDTQDVVSDDLNNLASASNQEFQQRSVAILANNGGIFGDPSQANDLTKNCYVSQLSLTQITVAPGIAQDASGNFINVPSMVTISLGSSSASWSWLNPQLGTFYVKLSYQETSGAIKTDINGVSHPTRYYESYFISVDTNPPTSSQILLASGSFNGTEITNVWDARVYAKVRTTADAVVLDPSLTPTSLTGFEKTVQAHVNATGSGTPASNNPHGLTLADLGYTPGDVVKHIEESHVPGIVPLTLSSAAFNSYSASVTYQVGTANAYISFAPPTGAVLVVGGNVYTSSLPPVTVTPPISGVYSGVVYVLASASGPNITTMLDLVSNYPNIQTSPFLYPNLYLLASVQFNNTDIVSGTLIDYRRFFTISPEIIRADLVEDTAASVPTTGSLLDNLRHIRNQLGKAINGIPSNWSLPTPPLTAGPSSNADQYHTHTQSFGSTFTLVQNSPSDFAGEFRIQRGTFSYPGQYASLYWDPTNQRFALYSVSPSSIGAPSVLSPLLVQSLYVGASPLPLTDNLLANTNRALASASTNVTYTNLNTLTAGSTSSADLLHSHHPEALIGVAGSVNADSLNKLTAGSSSNASLLHSHNLEDLINVKGTGSINASNLSTLTAGPTSNADALHTHAFPPLSRVQVTSMSWQTTGSTNTYFYNGSTPAFLHIRGVSGVVSAGTLELAIIYNSGSSGIFDEQDLVTPPGGGVTYFNFSQILPPNSTFKVVIMSLSGGSLTGANMTAEIYY